MLIFIVCAYFKVKVLGFSVCIREIQLACKMQVQDKYPVVTISIFSLHPHWRLMVELKFPTICASVLLVIRPHVGANLMLLVISLTTKHTVLKDFNTCVRK